VSEPTGNAAVAIDVALDPFRVPVPSVCPPLVNVTVPVAPDVTVAVIVTEVPYTLVPGVDTVTVDGNLFTVCTTVPVAAL
jgi:hypothetical protein